MGLGSGIKLYPKKINDAGASELALKLYGEFLGVRAAMLFQEGVGTQSRVCFLTMRQADASPIQRARDL